MQIPKYIQEIAVRLRPIIDYENCDQCLCTEYIGYVYALMGKYQYGRNTTLPEDAIKLCDWAARQSADLSRYIETKWYSKAENRRGFRDKAYLILTDPVALRLEKAGFLKR